MRPHQPKLGAILHITPTESRIFDWIHKYKLTGAIEHAQYFVQYVRMPHAEYKAYREFLKRHGR